MRGGTDFDRRRLKLQRKAHKTRLKKLLLIAIKKNPRFAKA